MTASNRVVELRGVCKRYGTGQGDQGATGTACRPEPVLGAGRGGTEHRDRVAPARVGEHGVQSGAEHQPGGKPGPSRHQRGRGRRRAVDGVLGGPGEDIMTSLPRGNHAPVGEGSAAGVPGSRIEAPLGLPTAMRSWLT